MPPLIDRRTLLSLASLCIAPATAATRLISRSEIRQYGQTVIVRDKVCSLSVAVVSNGVLTLTETLAGCEASTEREPIYQAASLSKPLFAFLVLDLASRGKFNLDEPMSTYLPSGYVHRQNLFALRQEPIVDLMPALELRNITPRHLLSHTAGLPNWADSGPLRPQPARRGTWSYSGEGYVLLQRAIEQHLGEPLSSVAGRVLFGPLQMIDSTFHAPADTSRVARGTAASGAPLQLRFPPALALASGSLHTTAADFGKFLASLLSRSELLRQTTQRPTSLPGHPALHWGLGWGIDMAAPEGTLWHWGNNPGYRSLALVSLGNRRAVVVLTNSDLGMLSAKALAGHVVPEAATSLSFPMLQ